jgi:hypothetical protein
MNTLRFYFRLFIVFSLAWFGFYLWRNFEETQVLKQIISRLQADSRIAQVMVTEVKPDSNGKKDLTTIKFLEYDSKGNPLVPRYFTFSGNIIQFQSLVIRFDDIYVKNADKLRGQSAYIFWKVFVLDGPNTKEYEITKAKEVPQGYKLATAKNPYEQRLWEKFWAYALDSGISKKAGIKNAQIEAPGTRFLPGLIYTIKIEHDGGMRIDSAPIPKILELDVHKGIE